MRESQLMHPTWINAIRNDDVDAFRALVPDGFDYQTLFLRPQSDVNDTILTFACHENAPGIVEFVLEAGADPNLAPTPYIFPLYLAAKHGHEECLAHLLGHGADVHQTTRFGYTGLHGAAQCGRVSQIDRLLAQGAEIDEPGNRGCTPLMESVNHANPAAATALIMRGADLSPVDRDGKTVLDLAREHSLTLNGTPLIELIRMAIERRNLMEAPLETGADPCEERGLSI